MAKTYRVACIGCSRMGSWSDDLQSQRDENDPWSAEWVPGAMATVCRAIDRVELVACCDLDRELAERMQQRWGIPAAYTDYLEMIEQERPDIVAIVTSYGSTHAALAAGVAETGLVKGIYCEKPIATSMAEADRIIAACRTHGVAYSCSHVARWNVRYRQALEWIQEGAIGEVRAITCSAMGTLLHLGTHQTDALAGFAGDVDPEWACGVVDVPADLPQEQWPTMDPTGGGYIMMSNGIHLLMEAASPWPRTFQISGSEGKIQIWNDPAPHPALAAGLSPQRGAGAGAAALATDGAELCRRADGRAGAGARRGQHDKLRRGTGSTGAGNGAGAAPLPSARRCAGVLPVGESDVWRGYQVGGKTSS